MTGVLIAARLLHLGSALALFGSTLFFLCGYASAFADSGGESRRSSDQSILVWTSIVGVLSAAAWLLAESTLLTGGRTMWRDVLMGTRLGGLLALRATLLTVCCVACAMVRPHRLLWAAVSLLAGLAVATFAWTGHGTLGDGDVRPLHVWADVLHLLSASVWIGALIALTRALWSFRQSLHPADVERIVAGLGRFSAIGPAVVAVLVLTGLINSWVLVGVQDWRALFGSVYGLILMVKIALFAVMLGLATLHRYRTVPALRAAVAGPGGAETVVVRLRASMTIETVLALLILVAVAALGTLEPPPQI